MKTEASYDDSSYEDFEPYCMWKQETTSIFKKVDIVEIQLRGFKKEELKNEFVNDNFLHICGEHPMGKRIKRFSKKIDVSKYDIQKIEATFEDGNIHLRLPVKRCAIGFRNIRDSGTAGMLLYFGDGAFKCTIIVVLLSVLVFYVYKYSLCTNFQNWFK